MNTTEKPIYCKSCCEKIRLSATRRILEQNPLLCDKCISLIIKKLEIRKIGGIKVLFLSEYDGIMKTWLMNYKERGDVELAPCFLSVFRPFLTLFCHRSIFVFCPSSEERIRKRGFDHLSLLLQESGYPYLSALRKDCDVEQKNTRGLARYRNGEITLTEIGKNNLKGKEVVLFDDVFTTGNTFLQSLTALKESGAKSIRGVILMDNEHIEKRMIQVKSQVFI